MRLSLKKAVHSVEKPQVFLLVLKLSEYCPKVFRKCSESCLSLFFEKSSLSVRILSGSLPKVVLKLSAQNRKKRTTPFGGMARPYYSIAPYLFHSFSALFHLSYLLALQPLKFSQECSK
jgi:hypothetical protein